jgi:hypothetical protein
LGKDGFKQGTSASRAALHPSISSGGQQQIYAWLGRLMLFGHLSTKLMILAEQYLIFSLEKGLLGRTPVGIRRINNFPE